MESASEALRKDVLKLIGDPPGDEDDEDDWLNESLRNVRHKLGIKTDICPWSDRHYSCEGRALQLLDGRWIGFPYWHGGGKHGTPWEYDWIEDAIWLDSWVEVKEVRMFKQKEGE